MVKMRRYGPWWVEPILIYAQKLPLLGGTLRP